MSFQRIEKEYARHEGVVGDFEATFLNLVANRARIHDNCERPVKALVDGNKDKLLRKDINVLLGSP